MIRSNRRGAPSTRESSGASRALRLVVCLGLAVAVVAGCAQTLETVPPPDARDSAIAAPAPTVPPAPAIAEGVIPARVSIPKIGIDRELIDLGLSADGSMEVPTDYDDIGWFTPGGKPGGRGPTVIAGHVDGADGPAVFVDLTELQPGDEVIVTGVDGSQHRYVVDRVADYPKDQFPTVEVFAARPTDELRLITCTGTYDFDASSYVDNRVVYAVRA